MAFMAVDTQPGLFQVGNTNPPSQVGIIPPPGAAFPPNQDLAGWYSLFRQGADIPVFDFVTLIGKPTNPTDAISLGNLQGMFGTIVPAGGDIQAAINALPATGGVITLEANATYTLTSSLSITKPDVTIQGGSWLTVIKRGPGMTGQLIIVAASATRFAIRNLTIDGNAPINNIPGVLFELSILGPDSVVQFCHFTNMGGQGALALGGTGSRAIGNRIHGQSSTTLGIGSYGIYAATHVKVTIQQNYITGTSIAGIVFDGPGTQVIGNYLTGCQCAAGTPDGTGGAGQIVHVGGFPGALIEANYVDTGSGPASYGISLSGFDISIIGNSVIGQKSHGILIAATATSGILMVGNTVLNSGQAGPSHGLEINSPIDNLVISGNRFADTQAVHTQTWGIFFNTALVFNQLIVTGNDLTGNVTGGLSAPPLGTNHVVSNNLNATNQPGVPSVNATTDAGAQAAGVQIGGQYRNGSQVMVRVA